LRVEQPFIEIHGLDPPRVFAALDSDGDMHQFAAGQVSADPLHLHDYIHIPFAPAGTACSKHGRKSRPSLSGY
jgi:hypothetical protein